MIRYDGAICRDLQLASAREWLETNGLGGFASSTIAGMNTRRYHGLLVAATQPPLGRMVLLSKLEEVLTVGGEAYELSTNQYPGAVHPRGYLYLTEFRLDPFPVFVYEVGAHRLEKSVFMVRGENTTVIRYELCGPAGECTLELRPLIAFRDYHGTTHENNALNQRVQSESGNLRITPYAGLPSLFLAHDGEVHGPGEWYRNFEYEMERRRGLDYREDLFNPCTLVLNLGQSPIRAVIASTEPHEMKSADTWRASEIERRARSSTRETKFEKMLARAAEQFIVKRGEGQTVLAGYQWFGDWGRDTMIALPGLMLSAASAEVTRSILRTWARLADHGMLPNRFADAGEAPEYNTVDATLWFFEAVRAYLAHTGDVEFVRTELYDVLADIIHWHEAGTRFGIKVDGDGLVMAGEPGVALTWMDARIGDRAVTPRYGKAVEVQALWYNALRVMEDLSGDAGPRYREMADRARASFSLLFWNPAANCLYDVIDGDTRDASIRPNQIFAASLPHKIVTREQAARIVDAVERHLLTPFGLRSLSPSDPKYRGRYEGDPAARDGAYHQGTVWPWLMRPFVSAYLEVHGRSAESRKTAGQWLSQLSEFMENEGVGQLPEIFDGDAPHRPCGCIAQAWTVAEVLRVCLEVL